jgi:integrase
MTPSPIYHAIDAYLAQANLAPTSADKYRKTLWRFAETVDQLELEDLARPHCRSFLARYAGASPATRALYTTILRRFFQFLVDEDALERSPMDGVKRPRLLAAEDLDVVTVSDAEVERLIGACRDWQETLCVLVLAYLGVRRAAASRLRRRDLDLDGGWVRFHEKRGKTIDKPIPLDLVHVLRLAEQEGLWPTPDSYVIPNRDGSRVRSAERWDGVIYETVRRVALRAGVSCHVHALRSAFAVRFLDQNPGRIDGLQALLGHGHADTTAVYLRRYDKRRAMAPVRTLSWGEPVATTGDTTSSEVLPQNPLHDPEPRKSMFSDAALPPSLSRKLDEVSRKSREQQKARGRRG